MDHKAGYVNIIGKPNVGKSTLMNDLVGEKISIITSKAQTTRHRILGIVNGDDFQIVFSDTPGIIKKEPALLLVFRFVLPKAFSTCLPRLVQPYNPSQPFAYPHNNQFP